MPSDFPAPEAIDWHWDDTASSGVRDRAMLPAEEGDSFVFTAGVSDKPMELKRARAAGDPIWRRRLQGIEANSAALLRGADQLYGAFYVDSAPGGHVIALDPTSGETLWAVRLEGIGPILHSKYSNRVQLRFINGWLVVFGDESGGKYIEVLEPKTGRLLSNKRG